MKHGLTRFYRRVGPSGMMATGIGRPSLRYLQEHRTILKKFNLIKFKKNHSNKNSLNKNKKWRDKENVK
ncbi:MULTISPECIES: hypothetical protein [Serratia]|nr:MULTISPECIES: hypothetical protein [Serratia]EGT0503987.1 hypothetical protein [Serratia marcescens]EIU0969924.1 hypothetical protein [Serratia marcescens]EJA2597035.1 hypothetical protein [Serratia marcescens]EMB7753854.1 hypothetical protein [Serratia marcescens]EME9755339.1 hypothetical protein [Serratia marcescens]